MSKRLANKTSNLIEKARESALLAIDVYNKPKTAFRSGVFIVLMCIAWLSLLQAIFEKRKISYFYRKNGTRFFEKIDGEKKSWSLLDSVKEFFSDENDPIRINIEFFIALRNKIEHRFMPEIDSEIFAECQALLLNFEEVLVQEFGEKFSITETTFLPLQVMYGQRDLPKTKDGQKIVEFINNFRGSISNEVLGSQNFGYKIFVIPNVGNHRNSSDSAIQFIKFNDLSEEERDEIQAKVIGIRDRNVPVVNMDRFKPGKVLENIKNQTGIEKNMHWHTQMWKKHSVRPISSATNKSDCKTQYCVYDDLHNDYGYTNGWVDFLIKTEINA